MATQKQIDANRRNARQSTGPRTPEGKAASKFNALQHGIYATETVIAGEVPADLRTLCDQGLVAEGPVVGGEPTADMKLTLRTHAP